MCLALLVLEGLRPKPHAVFQVFLFIMVVFALEVIVFCHNKKMQGLHVGLNLAVAIALHNIPEVQNSTIQLLSL